MWESDLGFLVLGVSHGQSSIQGSKFPFRDINVVPFESNIYI